MDEYFCPKCDAILNNQYGFDPNEGIWRCTECGQLLMNDSLFYGDTFNGVAWYCDNCGALLNRQPGFTDSYGLWECTECGHKNGTTADDIVSEDQIEFSCPNCGVALDFQPGFNKYSDDWECAVCGSYLHHDYSDDEYEEVDSNSELDDTDDDYASGLSHPIDRSSTNNSESAYNSSKTHSSIAKKISWRLCFFGILILLVAVAFGVGYYEIKILTPVGYASSELIGHDYEYVVSALKKAGFSNVRANEIPDLSLNEIFKENKVDAVKIGFADNFASTAKYPSNFSIIVTYHTLERYVVPMSSKDAKGANYQDVMERFRAAGFTNISLKVEYDIILGWVTHDGEVKSVVINGGKKFSSGKEYRADAEIVITYHTYRANKPK